jgi:hypothetical protein
MVCMSKHTFCLCLYIYKVSYTPYTYGLKVILHNIFNMPTTTHYMKSSVVFSTYNIISVFKKFQTLKHFGVWILRWEMLNLYLLNMHMYIDTRGYLFLTLFQKWNYFFCTVLFLFNVCWNSLQVNWNRFNLLHYIPSDTYNVSQTNIWTLWICVCACTCVCVCVFVCVFCLFVWLFCKIGNQTQDLIHPR